MAGAKAPDKDILRQYINNDRFRAFEREVVQELQYEQEERAHKYEDARRAREKKARKKRIKQQASMSS